VPAQGGAPDTILANGVNNFAMWAPDGKRLAVGRVEGERTTVELMTLDGRTSRPLTTEGREQPVEWSPDGRQILYTSSRTGTGDVWIVPADSGSPRQLTQEIRNDWGPTFSPDGRWVAFLSDRGGQQDVWIVPAAGGEAIRVTDDAGRESDLTWTPTQGDVRLRRGALPALGPATSGR
jgi:TolB protein